MNGDTYNIGRHILYMDEYEDVKKVRETVQEAGVDPAIFIRTLSLGHFVKDFERNQTRSEIPGLKAVFPQIRETLSITTALAQLKVADLVIEGAEPYGFWKSVWRVEQMDQPKLNIPLSSSADLFGNLEDIKGTDQSLPKVEGGKVTSLAFDTSGDAGYYRLAAQVKRNWLRDNNFRAIELHLKQVGEAWYYNVGKYLWNQHSTAQTTTGTKASLYGSSATRLQALINVIESQIPNSRFTPDSMIIHPTDAYNTKVEQWGTGGPIPLISSLYFDKDHANGTEPGFAQLLNINAVWRTPWASQGTVLVYQKDKNFIIGLRQDLEFEDFGDTLMGLQGAVTSMRFDKQMAFVNSGYKVTSY